MRILHSMVTLWQKAPLPLRRWFVTSPLAPGARRFVNRIHPDQLEAFELAEPLQGHRMQLHWQTQKAFVFGTYEPEVTQVIQRVVRPDANAMDIGAHIGYHTLLLAKQVGPRGKVLAFEPVPENFKVLHENVRLNGYGNVILEHKAVMDRPGRLALTRNNNDPLTSTATVTRGPGIITEVTSVDDYLRDSSERVNFIKMDAEGAEAAILGGMRRVMARDRPVLLIELHGFDTQGHNHPALLKLRDAGYSFRTLNSLAAQVHVLAEARA